MPIKKAEDFVPSLYVINLIEKVLSKGRRLKRLSDWALASMFATFHFDIVHEMYFIICGLGIRKASECAVPAYLSSVCTTSTGGGSNGL